MVAVQLVPEPLMSIFEESTKLAFEENAVTLLVQVRVESISLILKLIVFAASSVVEAAANGLNVGASLTGFTVTSKEFEDVVRNPSLTEKTKLESPTLLLVGVNVATQ